MKHPYSLVDMHVLTINIQQIHETSLMELYTRASLVLLLCLLLTISMKLGCCGGKGLKPLCRDGERVALLSFKNGIQDSSSLSSWVGDECCQWERVSCDNKTGHVLELNLGWLPFTESTSVRGVISSALLELKHLQYFDLSCSFSGLNIPKFLGSISKLRYLNLSSSGFVGVIPHQLGNLSKLQYLDIGNYDLQNEEAYRCSTNSLYAHDLEWIPGLTSLKFLHMTGANLSKASNWLQVMNKLPFLSVLRLSRCLLHTIDPLPHVNFTSLAILDLSFNDFISPSLQWFPKLNSLVSLNLAGGNFDGPIPSCSCNMTSLIFLDLSNNNFISIIPDWMYLCTSLEHLDLRSNNLGGKISNDIGNLTSITYLDLSKNTFEGDILTSLANICVFQLGNLTYHRLGKTMEFLNIGENKLFGSFPHTLGECRRLQTLDLGMNRLSGKIPISLGGISSLVYLSIEENFFEGVISEKHFAGLTNLQILLASSNLLLTLQVSSNWTPPFQLITLELASCLIGPQFPAWLQTQKALEFLNMSCTGISDAIPARFWEVSFPQIDLSHNQISGNIPSLQYLLYIDLSWNNFKGPLPQISDAVEELYLSNNLLHGFLSPMLCRKTSEDNSLAYLDVSNNLLSGELPDCWMYWEGLTMLNLGNNNLTGHVPSSMGSLTFLHSLYLRNNHLSGNFPLPLKNCENLAILDLSENEFTGNIPAWIRGFHGRYTEEPRYGKLGLVLLLRSNKLNGSIPHEVCRLDSLQILDLGNNDLSGTIPKCFGNFTTMTHRPNSNYKFSPYPDRSSYMGRFDGARVVMKGNEYEYERTLSLLVGIDLSSNKLSGNIPVELTALHGLIFLNLSANHLHGTIPHNIGGLTSLESLDLSMNSLSGVIPPGLATMSFLSVLNLSYNNLSGRIPTGAQMQGFSPLSFLGNPELCGSPLTDDHACAEETKPKATATTPYKDDEEEQDGWIDRKWLYLGMAWGFVVGFWGILGPLALNRAWRHAYFRRLHDMRCKLLGRCL